MIRLPEFLTEVFDEPINLYFRSTLPPGDVFKCSPHWFTANVTGQSVFHHETNRCGMGADQILNPHGPINSAHVLHDSNDVA